MCISSVQTKALKAFCIILVSKRIMPAPFVLTVFLSQSLLHTVVKNHLMRCDSAMFEKGLVKKNVFSILTSYLDSVVVKKGTT